MGAFLNYARNSPRTLNAPVPLNVVELPSQITEPVVVDDTVGLGLTDTVVIALVKHPFASVPVTV